MLPFLACQSSFTTTTKARGTTCAGEAEGLDELLAVRAEYGVHFHGFYDRQAKVCHFFFCALLLVTLSTSDIGADWDLFFTFAGQTFHTRCRGETRMVVKCRGPVHSPMRGLYIG